MREVMQAREEGKFKQSKKKKKRKEIKQTRWKTKFQELTADQSYLNLG
jgi:hypothetical protein